MKKYFFIAALLFLAVGTYAQTPKIFTAPDPSGYVKTFDVWTLHTHASGVVDVDSNHIFQSPVVMNLFGCVSYWHIYSDSVSGSALAITAKLQESWDNVKWFDVASSTLTLPGTAKQAWFGGTVVAPYQRVYVNESSDATQTCNFYVRNIVRKVDASYNRPASLLQGRDVLSISFPQDTIHAGALADSVVYFAFPTKYDLSKGYYTMYFNLKSLESTGNSTIAMAVQESIDGTLWYDAATDSKVDDTPAVYDLYSQEVKGKYLRLKVRKNGSGNSSAGTIFLNCDIGLRKKI
jgi:hypothetical protein